MQRNYPFIYFVYYTARSQIEDEFHDFPLLCLRYSIARETFFNQMLQNLLINNKIPCTDLVTELMNSFIHN